MSKTKKEKVISAVGTILFDGNMLINVQGKQYKVLTDYCCFDLKRASQEHEIIVLIKSHLNFNELDTGFLVRTIEDDKDGFFGLKPTKASRTWSSLKYSDVVAWGYVDGGLNSDHFASCHLRPEDYPQFAGMQKD